MKIELIGQNFLWLKNDQILLMEGNEYKVMSVQEVLIKDVPELNEIYHSKKMEKINTQETYQ